MPLALGGFSFGGFIAAAAAERLAQARSRVAWCSIAPSTEKQRCRGVPADSVVIQGDVDELVPLQATLDWARPQSLPVIVFPGVGHFFHGQLALAQKRRRA